MNEGEWIAIRTRPRAKMGAKRPILVWHTYQGTLVIPFSRWRENRFYIFWMEMPDGWTETARRRPTREDADAQGCVIAQNRYGEIRTAGWHQLADAQLYPRWMRCPAPPKDHTSYRRLVD